MSRQPVVYTAGPLGFSEVGRLFHYDKVVPMLEELGFKVLDPWKLTPDEEVLPVVTMPYGPEKRDAWKKLNPVIGQRNEDAIRQSDLVVAVLDGVDVDSGTAAEIGCAGTLDKPTIGYRGDFRLSADNDGSTVNLQVEHFIYSRGGTIVTSLEDLKKALEDFVANFKEE